MKIKEKCDTNKKEPKILLIKNLWGWSNNYLRMPL